MTTATPATRTLRRDALIVLGLMLGLSLVLVACEILEVQQPSEADQGETIEVVVTIEQPFDDANPHRGVVSVLVPDDWAFVSGEYSGDLGSGDMVEDEGWADSTEIVLPAPAGMKWIGTISADALAVSGAPVVMDATLRFEVGQTLGDFALDYFTTNDAFGTADIVFGDNEDNTADTLNNVPITVNMTSANEPGGPPEAFALAASYPNPARVSATLGYTLARAADVRLVVFDVAGREVAVPVAGRQAAGPHEVAFDTRALPSGLYLYRLEADGAVVATRRMTVAR